MNENNEIDYWGYLKTVSIIGNLILRDYIYHENRIQSQNVIS